MFKTHFVLKSNRGIYTYTTLDVYAYNVLSVKITSHSVDDSQIKNTNNVHQ